MVRVSLSNTLILIIGTFFLLGLGSRVIPPRINTYIKSRFPEEEHSEMIEDGFFCWRFLVWLIVIGVSGFVFHLPVTIRTSLWSVDFFVLELLWILSSWLFVFGACTIVDFLLYTGVHSQLQEYSNGGSASVWAGWLERTKPIFRALISVYLLLISGVLILGVVSLFSNRSILFQLALVYVLFLLFVVEFLLLFPYLYRLSIDSRPLSEKHCAEIKGLFRQDDWEYRDLWLEGYPSPEITVHGLFGPFRHVFVTTGLFKEFTRQERVAAFRHTQALTPPMYNLYRLVTAYSILWVFFVLNHYVAEAGITGVGLLAPAVVTLVGYAIASWYGRRQVFTADAQAATQTSIDTMKRVLRKQATSQPKIMYHRFITPFVLMRPSIRQRIDALSGD